MREWEGEGEEVGPKNKFGDLTKYLTYEVTPPQEAKTPSAVAHTDPGSEDSR